MNPDFSCAPIIVRNLSKCYGRKHAVDDLSFEVNKGSIFGLLGTNGAGKTTTFKCMLGLARATSGEVRFFGEPLNASMFSSLSYVPEQPALYDRMTGREHLEYARRSFRSYDPKAAHQLVDLFGLDVCRQTRKLSKGQKSALAITLAFAIRPQILVLDEPSAGLDPVHQRHVLDLMIDAAAGGATILFSSHQIGQVERAADHVAIMHRGKTVVQGEVEQLRADEKVIEATFDGPAPVIGGLENDAHVRRVTRQGRLLRVYVRGGGNGVASAVESARPTSLRVMNQNLEDIFLAAVADEQSFDVAAESGLRQ
jgi:ABC-2 type transport system ATP-binding protein